NPPYGILEGEGETRSSFEPAGRPFPTRLLTVSDPGLIFPESACRWPQVFHTQAIRLRPMTLFNPVFNCQTPIVIRRLKTQADEGLGPQPKAGDSSRRSWLCRSASAPSQQACEPVLDRCSGPCSRPRHAAAWRSRHRAPAGWVAWATNAITEGRARFRIGTQWFSRSGCWNRRAPARPCGRGKLAQFSLLQRFAVWWVAPPWPILPVPAVLLALCRLVVFFGRPSRRSGHFGETRGDSWLCRRHRWSG